VKDITYHKSTQDQCSRIAFDRLETLHAFRPITIREIQRALEDSTNDVNVGVIVLPSNVQQAIIDTVLKRGLAA
jgi:naphthoate synthase